MICDRTFEDGIMNECQGTPSPIEMTSTPPASRPFCCAPNDATGLVRSTIHRVVGVPLKDMPLASWMCTCTSYGPCAENILYCHSSACAPKVPSTSEILTGPLERLRWTQGLTIGPCHHRSFAQPLLNHCKINLKKSQDRWHTFPFLSSLRAVLRKVSCPARIFGMVKSAVLMLFNARQRGLARPCEGSVMSENS